jgi:hypothetical protein
MRPTKLSPEVHRLLADAIPPGTTIATLANGKPNRIVGVTYDGVLVETEASKAKGTGPQLVDAWMLESAWTHLRRHGSLTNAYLVSSSGLNVKRSAAVCAILAKLPGVQVASSRPIELRFSN